MSWLDVYREVAAGELLFLPLRDADIPPEKLSISVPIRTRNSSPG